MKVSNCTQGTPEWRRERAGKVTASSIPNVTAKGKGNTEATTRRNYRVQIATEILTGEPEEEGYQSRDMANGKVREPLARVAYEIQTDSMVMEVGLIFHPTIGRAAASPDGVIGWDREGVPEGLAEFKCPKKAIHVGYILSDGVPTEYQPQMLWQMACSGAHWVDFVSFNPDMPEHLQLFIKRFYRDEARIEAITDEVIAFLGEVDELLAELAKARPFVEPESEEDSHGVMHDDLVPL